MKYSLDITLLPSDDIGVHFLWSKVMMQVHLALVEIQDSNRQVPVAVSFPNYKKSVNKIPTFIGCKLRLLSVDKTDLERLNIHKWLSRLADYVHIKHIAEVPSTVLAYENFNRRCKSGSPDKHIRRRMKRHNETLDQASEYFKDYAMKAEDRALPFIQIKSLTSDNDFHLSIVRKEVEQSAKVVTFNTYGFNREASLPKF
jgi:CRISPR-associated endonuclease Csy4